MGWLKPCYKQSPYRLQAALLAGSLLTPLYMAAPPMAHAAPPVSAWEHLMHRMSDPELSRISAQGFSDPQVASDRLFDHVSKYAAGGNAVAILGDLATLLNPPSAALLALLESQIRFTSMLFNPANPAVISETDGVTIIRLQHENLNTSATIRDSTGRTYGSVDIRGIDRGGTVLVVKRH